MDLMDRTLEDRSKLSAVLENPCPKSTLNQLYEQRHETGDIKFIIESEEIRAHRCVLAALSPKYKAQFYGPMAEQSTINVVDVSAAAFKEFLQFFYMDKVTLTVENIEDVVNLAKQSLVDEIVAKCTEFLFDVIGMDKLVWFYRLAIKYGITPLEEFCVKQIKAKTKSVFQTPDFLCCEQEMLCHILALDTMNCNEINVFNACISWAQAKCKQDGIDTASVANLRAVLGDAIFKIRFCLMSGDQFASTDKKFAGLLTPQESTEVYRTILLKANGEISSIFGVDNNKPRYFKQLNLQCPFIKGPPIMFDAGNDYLVFSCNKVIYLNGFVICNRIDGDIDVKVGGLQKTNFTKSTGEEKTKIIFENPVYVEPNNWCRIDISSAQKITHGFHIEQNVQQNDVSFQFKESLCNLTNSITRLIYHIID